MLGLNRPTAGSVVFAGSRVDASRRRSSRRAAPHADGVPGSVLAQPPAERRLHRSPTAARPADRKARGRGARVLELLDLVGLPARPQGATPLLSRGGQRNGSYRPGPCGRTRPGRRRRAASAPSTSDPGADRESAPRPSGAARTDVVFIAHDLAVVSRSPPVWRSCTWDGSSRRTDQGRVRLTEPPVHRALLAAVPVPDPDLERHRPLAMLQGEVPSPLHPPSGCSFRTRCPLAMTICAEVEPALLPVGGSVVACHAVNPLA